MKEFIHGLFSGNIVFAMRSLYYINYITLIGWKNSVMVFSLVILFSQCKAGLDDTSTHEYSQSS